MLTIHFIGTNATMGKIQTLLKNYAILTLGGKADLILCEIGDIGDLRHIPQKPAAPAFLYITTQNKAVIERIKGYKISGIFFPPLNGEVIKRKIDAVINLSQSKNAGMTLETQGDFDALKVKILAKAENIATLPAFAQKLLTLTSNDASSIDDIIKQIKMDQGISSRVMRMINSPFYGINQEISSIDRAAVMLGFNTIKNIALVAATNAHYNKNFSMYNTNGNALWYHAYVTAIIAEEIAKEMRLEPDAFFLAGLLHDIGKTILADFLVKDVSTDAGERRQLGIDHAELAGLILKRWQLRDDVISMVKQHHNPDNIQESFVIHFANRLAHCDSLKGERIDDCLDKILYTMPIKNQQVFTQKIKKILQSKSSGCEEDK